MSGKVIEFPKEKSELQDIINEILSKENDLIDLVILYKDKNGFSNYYWFAHTSCIGILGLVEWFKGVVYDFIRGSHEDRV